VENENDFILKNLKFVHVVANKLYRGNKDHAVDYEDYYNEGVIGLIHAARRFDPNAGYKFTSFAVLYIKGYIMRKYEGTHNELRYPAHIVDLARKIIFQGDSDKTPECLAEKYAVSLTYSRLALKYILLGGRLSLDAPLKDGENNAHVDNVSAPEDTTIIEVNEFLNTLRPGQREILNLLLSGYSQSDVSRIMGVSRQRLSKRKFEIMDAWKKWEGR
jgi:RNA polymerase sigma factor (sigma-70 family)